MSREPAKTADDETGPAATRFANITLGLAAGLCLFDLFFAFQMRRVLLIKAMYVLLAAALIAATRLRPSRRVSVALVVLPLFAGTILVAYTVEKKRAPDGTAALLAGRGWDGRGRWEVVTDLRREGKVVYPSISPRSLMTAEYLGVAMRKQELLPVIDGTPVIPLGAVSSTTTVLCNEGGVYPVYESDEHGFNNPKGIWGSGKVDVAALGDSFTQGFCVAPEKNTSGRIRERFPATLNLGMGGNGPLLALAGLTEYLTAAKPRAVLWFYFNNDLGDLEVERKHPLLMRYLEDGFRQGLIDKQSKIDEGLKEILTKKIEPVAPRWPGSLSAVGLTRQSTPMFLQDLVMNEAHSAGSAALRLDRLNQALTAKLVPQWGGAKPDFELFQRVLGKARERVAAWGGTLHFVYVPDMLFLKKKSAHPNREGALSAARAAGLPVIDVHPVFLAEADPSKLMFHGESHCNEEGYHLMAKTVLSALDGKL